MHGRNEPGSRMRIKLLAAAMWVPALGGAAPAAAPWWASSIVQTNDDGAVSVAPTTDNGCALAGYIREPNAYWSDDFFVVRLDSKGTIKWQESIGEGSYTKQVASAIQQTKDGGYIMSGWGYSNYNSWYDAWLFKLDSTGKITWQKRFGGNGRDDALSVQQTKDAGYIVAGTTDYYSNGDYDLWLLKFDKSGAITWQKKYGTRTDDIYAYSVQQTKDGGYIVAGQLTGKVGTAYVYDALLMKVDANGAITWQTRFGANKSDIAKSVKQAKDGGYIVAGQTYSYGAGKADAWVVKFDSAGAIVWQKALGGTNDDDARSVQVTPDGNYVVAGMYKVSGQYVDAWLFKLDKNGKVLWQKKVGGSGPDAANSVNVNKDQSILLAGYSSSYGSGNPDSFVCRFDRNGAIDDACTIYVDTTAVAIDTTAVATAYTAVAGDTFAQPTTTTATATPTTATVTTVCTSVTSPVE